MIDQTKVALQEQLILEHLKKLEAAEKNFLPFVRHVWPEFISGYHHRKIAKKFEDISRGKIKRLIVNMPPDYIQEEYREGELKQFNEERWKEIENDNKM
jgi:hypothetical protein